MRTPSRIDAIADQFVHDYAALDPLGATSLGIPGHEGRLPDLSPEGESARVELQQRFLEDVGREAPSDAVDEVTQAAVAERYGLALELHEAGEYRRDLNNIASPLQALREIFDLMPTGTVEDWENIASRMRALPEAVAGYAASLREGVRAGTMPALRQVRLGIEEADGNADVDSSFFTGFVAGARPDGEAPPAALAEELEAAAKDARQAFADLGEFLAEELAPEAEDTDAVGRERYELWSRYFLGARVDLDETYEWGREELARIMAEQEATAAELYGPGTTVKQAMERLNSDPERMIHGTDALREWMQATADEAIAALADVHFDIPGPVRTLEAMIAPTATGGIYYTGPSADFSRPGRMWWSVPEGVENFSTWYEKTTVYHEGVPGHHLQIAQTVYRSELLNMWRRMVSFTSGHAEGWALYAERLMEELGFLAEPGDRLGMLDAQRLRATRVVLDIGVHLGKSYPEELGGGEWTYENAWQFLRSNVEGEDAFLRFELHRYLGWPGQAPSYKVGQRLWEQMRDEARDAAQARGEEFSLKDWHRRALDVGSVGLDTLAEALRK
ncbi:MAG TPA: DUF885 domain-containing protein [Actinomycetales bacterium]|nr:DUF885 domain-containing protein [Actinomycetales bacterium]